MLLTASTIKDSLENVRFFVAANLASGVDHMLIFLDAPREPEQREIQAELDAHPRVTAIPTARAEWWAGERPGSLNVRQRTNANWARAVLAPLPWAAWLFHIDGDEVVAADPAALAAVPEDAAAVWLTPWEAVSQWEQTGRPTKFKRLLEPADLNLLHVLGALPAATNQAYFHGHVMGKSGVRPGSRLGFDLHHALNPDGTRAVRHEDPRLRVLHYDAPSGAEFVRKWTALAQAGPARYREDRAAAARALRSLVTRDLPEEVRLRHLRAIYDRTTADDVALLDELGLLGEHDPLAGDSTGGGLSEEQRSALSTRIAELADGPKSDYYIPDRRPPAEDAGAQGLGRRLASRVARRGSAAP